MKHYAPASFAISTSPSDNYVLGQTRDVRLSKGGSVNYYLEQESGTKRTALRKAILMNEANWFAFRTRDWKMATAGYSSVDKKIRHPSYQQIIKMGPRILPLILEELERELNHWFPALKAISQESPIPVESRGNMEKMRESWLAWGRDKGYLPSDV